MLTTSDAPARGPETAIRESRLWLVRHGQSRWNVAGRIQGQSFRAGSLTPTGRAQAEQAASVLADDAPDAVAVVTSDLARAAETAAIVAGRLGLPLEFDRGLREQNLGLMEGRDSVRPDGQTDVLDELWDEPYWVPPGGESVAAMHDRVHRTLRRLAADRPGAELIVVTHGGPVRVASVASLPPPGMPLHRPAVGNASITVWPGLTHTETPALTHTEMAAP
jgi:probable phosphoglycerate mutase